MSSRHRRRRPPAKHTDPTAAALDSDGATIVAQWFTPLLVVPTQRCKQRARQLGAGSSGRWCSQPAGAPGPGSGSFGRAVGHLPATLPLSYPQTIRVTLEWRGLRYTVPVGRRRQHSSKMILEGLSAVLPPGRLLAIMGAQQGLMEWNASSSGYSGERSHAEPSGAAGQPSSMHSCAPDHACTLQLKRTPTCAGPTGCGKSSLVNALAGRLPAGGSLEGEVLVNGLPRGRGFQGITAYVMQVGGVSVLCLCGWCAAVMQAVCRSGSSARHRKSIGRRPAA